MTGHPPSSRVVALASGLIGAYLAVGRPLMRHWGATCEPHRALSAAPGEYERRVIGFFDRALVTSADQAAAGFPPRSMCRSTQ